MDLGLQPFQPQLDILGLLRPKGIEHRLAFRPTCASRRSTPMRASRSWKPNPALMTPIDPTIELASTMISSAAQASQ